MTERKENEIAGSRELESLPNEKKKKKIHLQLVN
jgi:hypothetical protein